MLREAALDGDLESLLRRIPIRPGDVVPVPAGTVHALLAETLVCEIQRPSNITYRLWDWNREPPRELHVDQACAVTHFDAGPPPSIVNINQLTTGTWQTLARNPYFEIQSILWRPGQLVELMIPNTGGLAVNVVHGVGRLRIDPCDPERLNKGQTWFIPAGLVRWSVEAGAEGLRLLLSHPVDPAAGA
jgi:mannose-6-phosphate isomerase